MVFLPAGVFAMGDTHGDGHPDEQPVHQTALDAFWLDRTEVTNGQFARFIRRTSHPAPGAWGAYAAGRDVHPVVEVTWHDAVAYCRWAGKRLPTEAEWEYAARGSDGRTYPWGDVWDRSRANSRASGIRASTPVGAYPAGASPFNALDLAGNVWEWTASLYRPYPYAATDGREVLGASGLRVARGGSWDVVPGSLRSTLRIRLDPSYRAIVLGFRCVQTDRR